MTGITVDPGPGDAETVAPYDVGVPEDLLQYAVCTGEEEF